MPGIYIIAESFMNKIGTGIEFELFNYTYYSLYSCCVDSVAAMHVQGDAIVHYGHSCFTKTDIPVFTVLPKKRLNTDVLKKIIQEALLDHTEKMCLFYDSAYEHCKGKF